MQNSHSNKINLNNYITNYLRFDSELLVKRFESNHQIIAYYLFFYKDKSVNQHILCLM